MGSKHTNIIPIRYMSGTGGQFLSNFITAAKNKNNDLVYLSEHGNAHFNNLLDFKLPDDSIFGPRHDDYLKIDALLNLQANEGAIPAYYPAMHLMNIDILLNTFDKIISIYYVDDDVNDIALAFYGKYYVDQEYSSSVTAHEYVSIKLITTSALTIFKPYNDSNVLNISWKEMLHNDTNTLIDKISSFTSIPKDNFNIDNLLRWRETTIHCLDNISSLLNKLL